MLFIKSWVGGRKYNLFASSPDRKGASYSVYCSLNFGFGLGGRVRNTNLLASSPEGKGASYAVYKSLAGGWLRK